MLDQDLFLDDILLVAAESGGTVLLQGRFVGTDVAVEIVLARTAG